MLKQRLRAWLRPAVDAAKARGVTPNQLSAANLAVAAAGGLLLTLFPGAQLPLLLLAPAVLARMGLDLLDGTLARELDQSSPLGTLLNDAVEALGSVLLYLPLALHPAVAGWLVVLVVALGLCAEIIGLSAAQLDGTRRADGPFGKRDRALLFALVGLILALDGDAAPWLPWLLLPAVILTLVTIVNRIRRALPERNDDTRRLGQDKDHRSA
jgi:CDP-diacylglycerol--glycerol-3-phosphate 3-phosphatidyltransferase